MSNVISKLKAKKGSKKGFTLIEMLIVVAIIAVLVAIAVPVFKNNLDDAKKAADDANIQTAYTQVVLFTYDSSLVKQKPEFSNGTITFGDGSTYELKYYGTIDNSDKTDIQWKGSGRKS